MKFLLVLSFLYIYSNIFSKNEVILSGANYNNNKNISNDSTSNKYFIEYKIGDKENINSAFLYEDNLLILLIDMDASGGLLEGVRNYISLEKNGNEIHPFYISPEIDTQIVKGIKSGIVFYELEDSIKSKNWKDGKYILKIKNVNDIEKKVNIDSELLNFKFKKFNGVYQSLLDKYSKPMIETKLILTINNTEKKFPVLSDSIKNSLKSIEEEIIKDSDLSDSYLNYYLKSFTEDDISNSLSNLDNSFSRGNNKARFMDIYFSKSIEYADTLFSNKNFKELKDRSEIGLIRFKDISSIKQNDRNKLNFYNTYAGYYLMQTDQEIKDSSKSLLSEFNILVEKFKVNKNIELESYSILAIGNIYYVTGDNNKAIMEYIKLTEDINTPISIKEKASINLAKAKKE